jgi:hypothetical protein
MSDVHEFEIRMKKTTDPDQMMTGATTEVYLDGKKLLGCTKVIFEVEAGGIARATIEVVGRFAVHGQLGQMEQVVVPLGVPDEK